MRTRDRRIDRHRPVDLPGRVGLGEDLRQHPIPRPVTGVTAMPLPHRLPRSELLAGQVTPRDPGAEPVRDALHNPSVVTERVTTPPGIGRQQRSDPLPLRIREHPISRTRRPHPTRLPRTSRCIWETRPNNTPVPLAGVLASDLAELSGWAILTTRSSLPTPSKNRRLSVRAKSRLVHPSTGASRSRGVPSTQRLSKLISKRRHRYEFSVHSRYRRYPMAPLRTGVLYPS